MASRYEIQGNVQGLLDAAALGAPGTNLLTARSASVAVTGLPGMYAALTAVTGTAVDDTFTKTAHGLANGSVVGLSSLTGGAGLSERDTRLYFVVNTAANTFQLSDAPAGVPVNFTTDVTSVTVQRSPDLVLYTTETGATTTANPLTADSATGKINAWIKAPDYDMTVSGSGISTTTVRVRQSHSGTYNVFSFGAVGDNVADDTAAIQATITTANGVPDAPVHIPYGSYKMTASLNVPTANGMLLQGEGAQATILNWATDLGAGFYGVNATGTDAQQYHTFRDLKLQGPVTGTLTAGVAGCSMDGINLYRNWQMERCQVRGFRAGVVMVGDHQNMTHCISSQNHFNVLYPNNFASKGDQTYIGCLFDGSSFASVACEGSNTIDGTTWVGCHFGFGPYGFFKYDGTGNSSPGAFILNCEMIDSGFEACGMAGVWDESTGGGSASDTKNWSIQSAGFSWSDDADKVIANTTGAGNVTSGSNSITSVTTTARQWHTGQTITGTGILAGTTITAVSGAVGSQTLTISQNANATNSGVSLTGARVRDYAVKLRTIAGLRFQLGGYQFVKHASTGVAAYKFDGNAGFTNYIDTGGATVPLFDGSVSGLRITNWGAQGLVLNASGTILEGELLEWSGSFDTVRRYTGSLGFAGVAMANAANSRVAVAQRGTVRVLTRSVGSSGAQIVPDTTTSHVGMPTSGAGQLVVGHSWGSGGNAGGTAFTDVELSGPYKT